MIGHQRSIMAAMGIDVWIPQAAPCQQFSSNIWRDQAAPEIVSEILLKNAPQPTPVSSQTELKNNVDVVVNQPVEAPKDEPKVVEPVEVRPIVQIPSFNLEAICLMHCVIVIDATELTAEQQVLWSNIQRAVSADFFALQWPFGWVNLQDGRGAASYVQGFIDAMSLDKNVICLGDIPYLEHAKVYPLASLQQMIEQPLLKKRLWQFMQNKAGQNT
ncbi:hypothetical protein [Acinetobacter amyesii]|uniref:hypothetical protein n=1 Tax=Acinetobacter amyesii TaxID=2942470 RepID=UPI0020BE2D1D|nr:hypothetical protein [Acinetobacter amyesii]MCL6233334.1 hypothetical protein [Acinetobacter amyesii]